MGLSSRNSSGTVEFLEIPEKRGLERQGSRRDKSILDDIMGDPDDFKDLIDPEEDGGRWEDTVKEALDQEESIEAVEVKRRKSDREKDPKVHGTRYFVIKSSSHQNLSKSLEKNVWATQAVNEDVLNEAFESSERVLLVFSVNTSGHFQGYAQMTSRTGRRKSNLWNDSNDGSSPWGGVFSINWIKLYDLPFHETSHLRNPLNDHKPVKISRDCQELPREVGEELCALIDQGAERNENPKRKMVSADSGGTKKLRPDDVQNGKVESSSQKDEKHGKHSTSDKHKTLDKDTTDKDSKRERDKRQERGSSKESDRDHRKSRRSTIVPDEDLLNMSYEEYLRRHSLAHQQFGGRPAPSYGGPWMGPGPGMPDAYGMAAWYERGRPEMFYGGGLPPVPYGGMHPFDPTKWRGHPH